MVVYTVTYAYTNISNGFNATNYSSGTVYLNNIKSKNYKLILILYYQIILAVVLFLQC